MTTRSCILIVDDDEQSLDIYDELFRQEGYTVIKARDGVEALDRFTKCPADLVIVDLMMPRLNGLEFCARFRRNPNARSVPILVLTGLNEPETRQKALQYGASDFLAKPYTAAVLLEHVRALLAARK